ncbi:tRNA (guanosine(37)-N1)-methyltransferase TrmD [Ketobacter alkanivorans]|uniref:tRNA (guanine-N(1)-)-methyltransferase n=1 Tax=Ketobacter alkanivorans TaxID=1917421 RepID=A0A2K9LM15_9GAMM|nr:tRNA (guanosine(37)-N1)-methyltransferase TrmD [Ketobacter alkanivorans]AUM11854.1 tRNA (guanosine(37)-N1)-methyltransferase TrmD [Ketobacter alkanivorans]
MKFEIVTLFPEMFSAITDYGVTGRAVKNGLIELGYTNPRDFTQDVHRTVDDRPYGGGPGMLMLVEPLLAAIASAKARLESAAVSDPKVVYVSPQGRPFDQQAAKGFSERQGMVFLCGRYEGVDERVIDMAVDEEWSIGDYVLSGGELPVMSMIDATVRLLPGVLGHKDSAAEDSFFQGLLDCPHYTRPEIYDDRPVPKVLMSGHHGEIRRWRLKQSLGRTWQRRPDLINGRQLSKEERALLNEYLDEQGLS